MPTDQLYRSPDIYSKLHEYYKRYYRDALHLKDWEKRTVQGRYNEEKSFGQKAVKMALENGVAINPDSRVLVVGCGTGAELFHLYASHTKHVYGIEPFDPGIEICRMKAREAGLAESNIIKAHAEKLPFDIDSFDAIICFTVIEHVADVQQAFREILRVLKKGGHAFLLYPDYRYPEEPHFKISTFPPALAPAMARLHLKLKGRYSGFFETLNFVTEPDTRRYLNAIKADYSIIPQPPAQSASPATKLYCRLFGISRNQMVTIRKE